MASAKQLVPGQKIGDCHRTLQNWQSQLKFIDDELTFIDKLFNSYGFEPQTPNLFERLEQFKSKMDQSKKDKKKLEKALREHEQMIDGAYECNNGESDDAFCKSYNHLIEKVTAYLEGYQNLKFDIYSYAGAILKKRKPTF